MRGDWMQYSCALTSMDVAVREGAPIPVVAIYEELPDREDSLYKCWKIHPDFLKDKGFLFEMLTARLEEEVFAGVYQARQALLMIDFLSGRDDIPGRPTEGVSYPRGEGYEPLGRRPVETEDE
jgi:hypothetical protein